MGRIDYTTNCKNVVLATIRERYKSKPHDQASAVFLYSCPLPVLGDN